MLFRSVWCISVRPSVSTNNTNSQYYNNTYKSIYFFMFTSQSFHYILYFPYFFKYTQLHFTIAHKTLSSRINVVITTHTVCSTKNAPRWMNELSREIYRPAKKRSKFITYYRFFLHLSGPVLQDLWKSLL